MDDEQYILEFVARLKTVEEFVFVEREKNKKTARKLGLTVFDQEDIIRNLRKEEYIKGPVSDQDSSFYGFVWIFKHSYRRVKIYIKLKDIEIINNKKTCKCISFHEDNIK